MKIEAPQQPQQAEGETVGDAVYDRVAGREPAAEQPQEQVVDNVEEPQEIARIVLPPTPVNEEPPLVQPIGEAATDPAAATAPPTEEWPIRPRRRARSWRSGRAACAPTW